ncbi:MAG: hypothetical protein ABJL44_04635 [Algibacter sp.]
MGLFENVKKYFLAKQNAETVTTAPDGVCPNCWGRQEWEGEFYKKVKANNITPEHSTYDSFVHKVVGKLDKITLKEDTLVCETCKMG